MKLLDAPDTTDYNSQLVKNRKSEIIEAITELVDELSHVCSHIAEQVSTWHSCCSFVAVAYPAQGISHRRRRSSTYMRTR